MSAPDLARIIQGGFQFKQEVVEKVRFYCAPLHRAEVDTLILGCTHYPLVAPMLQRMLGRDVRLVTAGHAIAATAQRVLEARGLGRRATGRASTASSARATSRASATSAPDSCRCRWARSRRRSGP